MPTVNKSFNKTTRLLNRRTVRKVGGGTETFANYNIGGYNETKVYTNSPRVNGVLKVRPNSCSMSKLDRDCVPSYYTQETGSGNFAATITQGLGTTVFAYPPESAWIEHEKSLSDQAAFSLYNDIANNKANLAEMYATRQQTVDLVAATARRLAEAARHMKKGNLRAAAASLGCNYTNPRKPTFSGNWLAYQYGWKPLLSDVYSAVSDPSDPLSKTIVSRANSHSEWVFPSTNSGDVYFTGSGTLTTRLTMSCRITVTNSALRSAAEYGISNPALLAWELMPYSFVVDWFLPIGGYLQNLNALSGLTVDQKNTTKNRNYDIRLVAHGDAGSYRNFSFSPGWSRTQYKSKVRTLSIPSMSPLPQLKNPLSLTHGLNAIALLAEAFRRSK